MAYKGLWSPSGGENYQHQNTVRESCVNINVIASDSSGGIEGVEGLIAQQIQATCGRTVSILYEIGSKNYYAVDGRPQGKGTIINVIGPSKKSFEAINLLGDVCRPTNLEFVLGDCTCDERITENGSSASLEKVDEAAGGATIVFIGGYLSGMALSAKVTDFTVSGQWDFIFADVLVDSEPSTSRSSSSGNGWLDAITNGINFLKDTSSDVGGRILGGAIGREVGNYIEGNQ